MSHVMNNAELMVVVCDSTMLSVVCMAATQSPSVKHVVVMDDVWEAPSSTLAKLHTMRQVIEQYSRRFGESLEPPFEQPPPLPQPQLGGEFHRISSLMYTSGSTGLVKGVVVSTNGFRHDIGQGYFVQPLIGASYIPLSHSSDRLRCWELLGNGGRVGFIRYAHTHWVDHETVKKHGLLDEIEQHSGDRSANALPTNDVEGLMREMSALSPVAVAAPPCIWNGLYNIYKSKVAAAVGGGDIEAAACREIAEMFADESDF